MISVTSADGHSSAASTTCTIPSDRGSALRRGLNRSIGIARRTAASLLPTLLAVGLCLGCELQTVTDSPAGGASDSALSAAAKSGSDQDREPFVPMPLDDPSTHPDVASIIQKLAASRWQPHPRLKSSRFCQTLELPAELKLVDSESGTSSDLGGDPGLRTTVWFFRTTLPLEPLARAFHRRLPHATVEQESFDGRLVRFRWSPASRLDSSDRAPASVPGSNADPLPPTSPNTDRPAAPETASVPGANVRGAEVTLTLREGEFQLAETVPAE